MQELPRQALASEPEGPEYKLCREMLICFIKDEPETFTKLLPEDVRGKFDKKQFAEARQDVLKELGEPVSFQYVTSLEFPAITPHIWKVRFRRKMKDGTDLYREALFRILTGKGRDGEILVIGFNFL